ncbi:MAG TPA: hypothetical protein VFM63_07965 [Pyrinomonadaceae bacterium]|nr:hypothetical protein [Pyrinomonadaceae bacterium]
MEKVFRDYFEDLFDRKTRKPVADDLNVALNPLLIYIPQFNLRKIGLRCYRLAFFQGNSSIPLKFRKPIK